MVSLTYFVASSIDGRIAGPDGDFGAFPVVGDHIDMLAEDWSDTLPGAALDALGRTAPNDRFDTVVMGWRTYAAGFPYGVHDPYPHLRQVVFTHDPQRPVGGSPGGVEFTDAEPVDVVRRLKADSPVGVWLCGGGDLAGQLADEIDVLVVKVNPIVLGDGISLFAGLPYDPRTWILGDSTSYASGVVVNQYVRR